MSRLLALLTTLALLNACTTTISVKHDPLYEAITHTSTIEATAENNDTGIQRITIIVTTGEMTDCTELGIPASMIPCRRSASTVTHLCTYAGRPSTATCTYTHSIANEAIVTYSARAEAGGSGSATSPEITYSGGYPPTAGIARPIWWHRSDPRSEKIDVGFFPDGDYLGFYSTFTDDTETIVNGAYFNSAQNFSGTYTLFRETFNLWAAPFGADANGCTRSFDSLVSPIEAVMDGAAIVHDENFRDCASISLGGSGSVWANASDADWIFVHESGHFLHGQGDEYCCDGGYGTSGSCANVFSSEAACQTAAPAAGASTADCVQIGTTGAWRNDDGSQETMEDRTDNSNWQDNSADCVIDRLVACSASGCY